MESNKRQKLSATCVQNLPFHLQIFYSLNRKQGDGLFLKTCEQVSKLYPKIKFEGMIVDNTCMQV